MSSVELYLQWKRGIVLRSRIQRKTWFMGPYPGVNYTLILCPFKVDHGYWVTLCQSRLIRQSRTLEFTFEFGAIGVENENAYSCAYVCWMSLFLLFLCVSGRAYWRERWGRSHIIRPRESLAFYISFNTLCSACTFLLCSAHNSLTTGSYQCFRKMGQPLFIYCAVPRHRVALFPIILFIKGSACWIFAGLVTGLTVFICSYESYPSFFHNQLSSGTSKYTVVLQSQSVETFPTEKMM